MTIDVVQNTGSTIQYIATAGQTVFPVPFPFVNSTDIVVQAALIPLANGTDFTVTGAGNDTGGSLTLAVGAVVGTVYTVSRVLAIQRLTEYQQNGPFTSAAINAELDNIVLIEQQLRDAVSLCLQIPVTNAGPVTLLTPANYASKYLAFDASGNPTPALLTTSGSVTTGLLVSLLPADTVGGILYPQTSLENSQGVTPSHLALPSSAVVGGGAVTRYQINTTPGTTDMSTGFVNAAKSNTTFAIPPGSYLTNTALSGQFSALLYGAPSFSGTNPFNNWWPAFGGGLQLVTTGNQNGMVSVIRNNLAPSTNSQPTALTALCRNDNGGNLAFAFYAPSYQYATTGVVSSEIDSFNMTAAPTAAFPAARGIGTPQNIPGALTLAAGGNFNSWAGLYIAQEGSSPQKFLAGQYFQSGACASFGILLDALLTDTCVPMLIKHSAAQVGVQVQGSGLITGVAVTGTAGQFSCTATQLVSGMQVKISGALGGTGAISGYSNPTTYAISATNGSTTFTLQTLSASAITTTAGTLTGLTFAATEPTGAGILYIDSTGLQTFKVQQNGGVISNNGLGLYGNSAAAQSTGWGTPTGNAAQSNYAAGSGQTMAVTSAALAQVIAVLKAVGILGA